MEKIEINPKTQFFGWFCGDIEKNLGNVFLKLIFMSILNNESIVVLEAIDKNIYEMQKIFFEFIWNTLAK